MVSPSRSHLFTVCHFFLFLSSALAHQLRIHDKCAEQCYLHRPEAFTGAYVLNCGNETFTEQERMECRLGCQYCEAEICDQRITPVQIRCRSTVLTEGPCKTRCDHQRPEGNFEQFSFTCDDSTLFPTGWDIRQCTNDCRDCPPNVCINQDEEFKCPAVNKSEYVRPRPPPSEPLYEGGKCEERCDKDRPPNKGVGDDAYEFACERKYESLEEERKACIEDCSSCPLNVCDSEYSPGVYTCPETKLPPLPKPPKPGKFIGSWTVIALIAVSILCCIAATSFYGRIGNMPVTSMLSQARQQQQQFQVAEVEMESGKGTARTTTPDPSQNGSGSSIGNSDVGGRDSAQFMSINADG